ncbi:MAG TPA: hypothetical protein GXZ82_05055 [Firmicutes bacterium]|jgi:hypothetical protein|nr:hypothetical protein [Bacillota bacterium]
MHRVVSLTVPITTGGLLEVLLILLLILCITVLLQQPAAAAQSKASEHAPAVCALTQADVTVNSKQAEWISESALKQAVGYILAAQQRDGAILVAPTQGRIVPYFANYAAFGLIAAHQLGLNANALPAAQRWIRWYANHMDEHGYVHDYSGFYPLYQDTGDMDSTDAYAGTFLALVWRYYQVTRDDEFLRSLEKPVRQAVAAILSTMNADYLTWAKPTYKVKYLMDNLEVWFGFVAAVNIAAVLELPEADEWAQVADKTATAVKTRYIVPGKPYLASSIGSSGAQTARFDRLYPDALANLLYLTFVGDAASAADRALFATVYDTFYKELPTDQGAAVHVWTAQAACVVGDVEAFNRISPLIMHPDLHKGTAHSLAAVLRMAAALQGEPLWF